MNARRILLGSIVSVALLAGCGDEDQESPIATVRAFYDAVGTGDGGAACDLVTGRYVRQLEYDNPSCEAVLGTGEAFGARAEEARVTEVDQRRDRAIVTARLVLRGERRDVHASLIRHGDEWLIDTFDARSRSRHGPGRLRRPTP